MANPNGNPNIRQIAIEHKVSFGEANGVDPAATASAAATDANRSSVRGAIRRLSVMDVDITKSPTQDELAKHFGRDGSKISMAQALAVRKFANALKGDTKAMQQIEDSIDGKVPNTNITTDMPLADLIAAARQELRDESRSNRED